jgi:3-hydroxybutyryl-CoA dehydrogenase
VTISRIAVIGAGYMGGGIAQTLAMAGHRVLIADADAALTRASVSRLIEQAERYEADDLVPAGAAAAVRANLSAAETLADAVADADFITEAVTENLAVKSEVLGNISRAARSDAIIATNTSAIRIADLAAAVEHPLRFLGVHWFNPVPFLPLVELCGTDEPSLLAVERMLADVGKVTVRVPDVAGFLGNRLQFALYKEALAIVEEGLASPEEVDTVVSNSFGYRLPIFGPIAVGDMSGLDVYLAAFGTLEQQYGERFRAPQSLAERVASGDLGLKSGGGFRGVPEQSAPELTAYRDRAYRAMAALRADLGRPPGL